DRRRHPPARARSPDLRWPAGRRSGGAWGRLGQGARGARRSRVECRRGDRGRGRLGRVTEAEAVEGVDEAQPLTRAAQLALLSPARAAFHLAWPGIIEQLIRASGQTVVIAFIGHLGAVATAAVGASLQFTFLLFPVFNALSIGTVALVSRRMGERRAEAASSVVRQSLV